jgi:hypothetical protein
MDFPDSFENPGNPGLAKSKQKICFYCLVFTDFIFGHSGFLFGFRRFCLDFTGFEFFGSTIQTKNIFCLDFLDFYLDFT